MTHLTALEERVRRFAAERAPSLMQGRAAVLAASGGGDSTAMVALLCEAGIVDPKRCVVAHFDHRLRGDASSLRDRSAVAAFCCRYRLQLVEGAWDAPRGGESAARAARYAFLQEVCRQTALDIVVTGHTADDQAETVLMHAIRGAGVRGLAGMAVESPLPLPRTDGGGERGRSKLIRPLLGITRHETRAYCVARDIAFVDDSSNEDATLLRNRIRHQLLPALELRAPDIRLMLSILAETARCANVVLDVLAGSAIIQVAERRITMSRDMLRRLDAAIAVHAFRLALERLLGDARDFDRRHYASMAAATAARTGSRFQLPRGTELTVDSETLVLSAGQLVTRAVASTFQRRLPFIGDAGEWRIEVMPSQSADETAHAGEALALRLKLPAAAVVRAWRPGDRLQPPGMSGHKKLQDYYVDHKVPRRERLAAPVIADSADILWTPFGSAAQAPGSGTPSWIVKWRRRPP